ncbi:RNA-binding protein [Bacilli bacterium PM5-3]|nr:RNA-binding protein [Bacilli bacterium PM5-3]MDH6603949.1 RNA-binding protein [Bacilli bacterium PM5-9]
MVTKQQKQYLKSLAHSLKPIFQVGKNGVNNEMVVGISDALEHRELIKISILQNCPFDKKEVAFDLQRLTNSEIIQVIGRTIVLYRKSKTKENIL